MKIEEEDFLVDTTRPDRATLEGVLRLSSPAAYEERFEPLKRGVDGAAAAYTIDISKVRFINSSGITGLSRLVLQARALDKPLVLVGQNSVSWQGTTLNLFKRLYKQVEVRLV
jgi:hypothetical protein